MPLFITATLAFTALVVLVVAVIATVTGRRGRGLTSNEPRTPEQKAQDRQTGIIWLIFLGLVMASLLMAYAITR